jgi:hypothetical protein
VERLTRHWWVVLVGVVLADAGLAYLVLCT